MFKNYDFYCPFLIRLCYETPQLGFSSNFDYYLRNRSALAVNCCVIIHCLEVSCKEDQITSAQRE